MTVKAYGKDKGLNWFSLIGD